MKNFTLRLRMETTFQHEGLPHDNAEDNMMLMAPFQPQEILDCVKACAGHKDPEPDGYIMVFFSLCWQVIGPDVIAAEQNFHSEGFFEKRYNATFVAQKPKKGDVAELSDFRPVA
ncbi:hypothetical protein H5410_055829 [Solanum commersonii]|uniref:Uncharacterized protein n=1 Tax=Solanum commersonii TaxID=4109 RepID=A0A9J5WKA5_SOLCO|nr:hypothetical protein H5410_055829 [Solanum commersonii]